MSPYHIFLACKQKDLFPSVTLQTQPGTWKKALLCSLRLGHRHREEACCKPSSKSCCSCTNPAWLHRRSCRRKEQQNLIFVIKVRHCGSVCPQEAELMSKKMPFSCSPFSAQNSLFMLRAHFCKNPYWGQHNLLIIEVSRKFCFSENWQIKSISQFFKKKITLYYAFILNIRIQQISWEQPLCKTLIFWEWIVTVIAKTNSLLLHHIPCLWMSAFTSTLYMGDKFTFGYYSYFYLFPGDYF